MVAPFLFVLEEQMSHTLAALIGPDGYLAYWQLIALLAVVGLLVGYVIWKKKQG